MMVEVFWDCLNLLVSVNEEISCSMVLLKILFFQNCHIYKCQITLPALFLQCITYKMIPVYIRLWRKTYDSSFLKCVPLRNVSWSGMKKAPEHIAVKMRSLINQNLEKKRNRITVLYFNIWPKKNMWKVCISRTNKEERQLLCHYIGEEIQLFSIEYPAKTSMKKTIWLTHCGCRHDSFCYCWF